MTDRRVRPLVLWTARLAAVVGLLVVLSAAFRAGWTRISTDFPNHYTAAVAVRHHDPLPNIYDWTWFARQMNYERIENQLGGYMPQSPATMLPIVPIAGFPPLYPHQDPLGSYLALDAAFMKVHEYQVIGIVKDVRFVTLTRLDAAHIYL